MILLLISDPRRGCYIVLPMFIFFFSATILSGSYLWNRYSQRLQNWVCCLVLQSSCALLLTIQFASLFYFVFFRQDFVRVISLEPLLAETPNLVCCLVLQYCLPSNSLRYFFFFFFCHDFVRAISLEPLLAETPNWVCCLVLRSNFALLLTIQFALLLDQSSGDRSSVAYRATENRSRSHLYWCSDTCSGWGILISYDSSVIILKLVFHSSFMQCYPIGSIILWEEY